MLDSLAAAPPPSESPVVTALRMYADLLNDAKEQRTGAKGLVYQIAAWHIMLKMLRLLENRFHTHLVEEVGAHSDVLDQLISMGIGLQTMAASEQINLSKRDHGTTNEELKANVDWLRDKRAMWYGDVTPKRKAAVLQAIFGHAAA